MDSRARANHQPLDEPRLNLRATMERGLTWDDGLPGHLDRSGGQRSARQNMWVILSRFDQWSPSGIARLLQRLVHGPHRDLTPRGKTKPAGPTGPAGFDKNQPRRSRTALARSRSRSSVVSQSMHLSVTDWP